MPHAEWISADSPFAIKRLGPGDAEHARSMNALFGNVFDDDPAIALYTKLGSREDVMHFDLLP